MVGGSVGGSVVGSSVVDSSVSPSPVVSVSEVSSSPGTPSSAINSTPAVCSSTLLSPAFTVIENSFNPIADCMIKAIANIIDIFLIHVFFILHLLFQLKI